MKSYINLAALALVACLGGATAARAEATCDLTSLSGAYGYSLTGFTSNGFSTNLVSALGRFVADGSGGLSIKDTVSQGGSVIRTQKYSGRYTINSDCTGTLSLNGYFDFVLVNNNMELHLISVDQGANITGTAKKQVIPFVPVLQ